MTNKITPATDSAQRAAEIEKILDQLSECFGYPNPMVESPCLLRSKARPIIAFIIRECYAEQDAKYQMLVAAAKDMLDATWMATIDYWGPREDWDKKVTALRIAFKKSEEEIKEIDCD